MMQWCACLIRDQVLAVMGGIRRGVFALLAAASLSACAASGEGLGYYWQSASGHSAVMTKARPVDEWLADPATEPWLREKLTLAREAREFASRELGLPDNGSYTRYVDLQRQYVVWNVFATPELSMQLKQWCYPIVGCATYRGFYKQDDAQAYAKRLRDEGMEAYVAGIPAYSTLGWFDDPLLSSFIRYPDAEVARTIFHELSHQILYVQGDTTFNESFATAVEEIGLDRWLATRKDQQALRQTYEQFKQRKHQFVALLKKHRKDLETLYGSAQNDDAKRAGKATVFAALQSDYQALKLQWNGFKGYDAWFAQSLTNAHLATVATYTELVPAFHAIYQDVSRASNGEQRSLKPFFEAVLKLSREPRATREQALGAKSGPVIPSPVK